MSLGGPGHCPSAASWIGSAQWLWDWGEEIQTGTAENCAGDVSTL